MIRIPTIKEDKANHLIGGVIVYAIASIWIEPVGCLYITSGIGFAKEFYDVYRGKTMNLSDIWYTMIGGVLALLVQLP
jgi:hypothetical protein